MTRCNSSKLKHFPGILDTIMNYYDNYFPGILDTIMNYHDNYFPGILDTIINYYDHYRYSIMTNFPTPNFPKRIF